MALFTYRNAGSSPRTVVIEPWAWAEDIPPNGRVHIEYELDSDQKTSFELEDCDDGSLYIGAWVEMIEIRDDDRVYMSFRKPPSLTQTPS